MTEFRPKHRVSTEARDRFYRERNKLLYNLKLSSPPRCNDFLENNALRVRFTLFDLPTGRLQNSFVRKNFTPKVINGLNSHIDSVLEGIPLKAAAAIAVFLLFLAAPFPSNAQAVTNSFNTRVYADGSAAIVQSIAVSASDVSITIPLLSSIITNVIATDQNGSPLSFQISGNNITVYTIGATHVTIQYDTDALTSKQGTVWTLAFTTSYNLTITLPTQSSLSSVSGTPTSLSEQNGSPVVVVPPGKWSISYGVPIEASVTSTNGTGTTTATAVTTNASRSTPNSATNSTTATKILTNSDSQFLGFGAVAMIVAAAGFVLFKRRSNADREGQNTELRPDDIQILDYITEKGGKVFEQEIRSRFTVPKTSAWRQIKRLERLGYVKVYKVGSQNQIELLKKRE
jgi:uncharacterized membrane protein